MNNKKIDNYYKNNYYKFRYEELSLIDTELNKAFLLACEKGEINKINYLLGQKIKPDINFIIPNRTWEPKSGIELAYEFGHMEIVKFLLTDKELKKCTNVSISSDYLFRHACIKGDLKFLVFLIKKTSLNIKRELGYLNLIDNSLVLACVSGKLNIVKYLLTNENADINFQNDMAFKSACTHRHLKIIKYLMSSEDLKQHSNIYSKCFYDKNKDIRDLLIFEMYCNPNINYRDKNKKKLYEILNYLLNETFDEKIVDFFYQRKEFYTYMSGALFKACINKEFLLK